MCRLCPLSLIMMCICSCISLPQWCWKLSSTWELSPPTFTFTLPINHFMVCFIQSSVSKPIQVHLQPRNTDWSASINLLCYVLYSKDWNFCSISDYLLTAQSNTDKWAIQMKKKSFHSNMIFFKFTDFIFVLIHFMLLQLQGNNSAGVMEKTRTISSQVKK